MATREVTILDDVTMTPAKWLSLVALALFVILPTAAAPLVSLFGCAALGMWAAEIITESKVEAPEAGRKLISRLQKASPTLKP